MNGDEEREAFHALQQLTPARARWPFVVLAVALVMLALSLLQIASAVTANTKRSAANRDAIRVSCTLLANAIEQSGAGSTRNSSASRPPVQRLNQLYVSVVVRSMTDDERRQLKRLTTEIARTGGGRVDVPDCAAVVRNPNTVQIIRPNP